LKSYGSEFNLRISDGAETGLNAAPWPGVVPGNKVHRADQVGRRLLLASDDKGWISPVKGMKQIQGYASVCESHEGAVAKVYNAEDVFMVSTFQNGAIWIHRIAW
jgi:hypothetical protein